MSLLLHCGGIPASIPELGLVPMPEKTDTYTPVPFDGLANLVLDALADSNVEIASQSWGLNHNGAQMFGLIQAKALDGQDTRLTYGVRSSHDSSMAVGLCGGASVLVCDNLCFSGSDFTQHRRHTGDALNEIKGLVLETVKNTVQGQARLRARFAAMKALPVDTDRGYELLGLALGGRLLTSKQATRAFGDWRKPEHPEFAGRNLWSLYNSGTSAMKLGPVRGTITRHTAWDGFIRRGGVADKADGENALGRELTALETFYVEEGSG